MTKRPQDQGASIKISREAFEPLSAKAKQEGHSIKWVVEKLSADWVAGKISVK